MQRVTGTPYKELLRDYVFEPLGLEDTEIGPREDLLSRLAPVVAAPYLVGAERDEVWGQIDLNAQFSTRPGSVVPGSNMFSTAEDVNRLAQALHTGRTEAGELFISPAMLEFVSRNHTGTLGNDIFPLLSAGRNLVQYPAYLALGFWGRGPGISQGQYGTLTSPRTFGGYGRGTTMFWIDPLREATMTVLTTGMMVEADSFMRFSTLSDLLVSSFVD